MTEQVVFLAAELFATSLRLSFAYGAKNADERRSELLVLDRDVPSPHLSTFGATAMSAHKIALGRGHGRSLRRLAAAVCVGLVGWGCGVVGLGAARAADADVVVLNGRVYTAGPGRSFAQAIAVAGDKIVYVGDDAGARALAGRQTKIEDVSGRLILPGLIDTHVHPTGGLYPVDICDLRSQAKTLAELTARAKVVSTWLGGHNVYDSAAALPPQ